MTSGLTHKFTAGIALHGLCLAVPSIVVGSSALVARCSAVGCDTIATTAISTSETAAPSAYSRTGIRGWAIARDVAHLTTGIASTSGCSSADAQCRTVSLNVA